MNLAPMTIIPPTPVTMSTGQEARDQMSVAEACPLSSRLSKVEALGAVPLFSACEISRGRASKKMLVT
ncbi:hypothetical protein D9M68_948270 [compost metagenome]